MVKPFDFGKLRKNVTKSIDGISIGFHDPSTWISTGNFALNYRISDYFERGIPLGKVTIIAGESGSGKSYLASGNLAKQAQAQGIFVLLIDTENALDEAWLKALGVSTEPDKLLKVSLAMIDDVAKLISDFMKDYKKDYSPIAVEERPKVLFIIDSLGMLLTPTDVAQFEAGDLKGDMGRKPKALTALVRNCVNMFGEWDIGMVCTNHSYASQDMFDPDDKISGGQGFIYASSIVIATKKLKLKLDENLDKVTEVRGIRAKCKIMKTRFSKPFEEVEILIPWETGMDPYSGLFDLFDGEGLFTKSGNSYIYIDLNGKEHKYFEKAIKLNKNGILDLMMSEFKAQLSKKEVDEIKKVVGTEVEE